MKAGGRVGGWARGAMVVAVTLLPAYPLARLSAQDSSAIDRGVRIGITYRPGVRPGMVVIPERSTAMDSVRTILTRDLDYGDRFEMISLPGGDSIRMRGPPAARGRESRAQTASLNYPLYQALGADFAVGMGIIGDSIQITLHDVTTSGIRRVLKARLPALTDPRFRMAVHRLADQIVEAAVGTPGSAATRIMFVIDGKLYRIDQDGAGLAEVRSGGDRTILSSAWAPDGRHITYMEFRSGHGQLFVQDATTGRRRAISDGTKLDFTPLLAYETSGFPGPSKKAPTLYA